MKPVVAVFFGGTSGSRDLSRETGYWVCQYIPRSRYRVLPIHITSGGQWQVPTGYLPTQGPVGRMMEMLWDAVPAVPAREGLAHLLGQPTAAWVPLVRGPGGDDGSFQTLGATAAIPVAGPTAPVCQQTSQKQMSPQVVGTTFHTPRMQHYPKRMSVDSIIDSARQSFIPPFYVKPANEEGSFGVERVASMDEAAPAIARTRKTSDVLIQEELPGDEVAVTLVDDQSATKPRVLPAVRIQPRTAAFYDALAKRRPGRVALEILPITEPALKSAIEAASAVYTQAGLSGLVTFDMKLTHDGPALLEINTVPALTTYSLLRAQLEAARLHPSLLLQRLCDRCLEMDAEPVPLGPRLTASRSTQR